MEWGRHPGPGGQGGFHQPLQEREGVDSGPQVLGSRGMAKGTSREKGYYWILNKRENLLFSDTVLSPQQRLTYLLLHSPEDGVSIALIL